MNRLRIGLAVPLLALAACATSQQPATTSASPAPASLAGTRWVAAPGDTSDSRQVARLEFVNEGRITGYTGCNMLSGSWVAEGGVIRLGPVITTKRACVGPENEVERRLLAAMSEKTRVVREDGKLVFVSDGARFEFVVGPGY